MRPFEPVGGSRWPCRSLIASIWTVTGGAGPGGTAGCGRGARRRRNRQGEDDGADQPHGASIVRALDPAPGSGFTLRSVASDRTYRTAEFAALAGLPLLASGYRLYTRS